MGKWIFLDTSGLFSYIVADDPAHSQASSIVTETSGFHGGFLTTDYIVSVQN